MLEYLIDDEYVCSGDRIAVAVSGGADSMLLLWALLDKQKKVDFFMKVIHVNHNLRGAESDGDSKFVQDFCAKKKIPCEIVSVSVLEKKSESKTTLEETARNLRYDAIFKVMKNDKLDKLFLAHHKNDQAETVLMHIFRGSGIGGAVGMTNSNKIIRPLLSLSKSEILQLAKEHGIKFVTDSTNLKNDTARNYLRNVIIPEIEKIYPNAVGSIYEFSKKCEAVQRYIEKLADNGSVISDDGGVLVKGEAFDGESFVVRERIKSAFFSLGVLSDIEEKHYKSILALMQLQVGSKVDLPHGVVARKTYQGIRLFKAKSKRKSDTDYPFVVGSFVFDDFMKIEAEIIPAEKVVYGDGNLYADLSKIPINSVWRLKKAGDMFSKLGSGSKKLSDYFTDKKIDCDARATLPVLATDSAVLVVAENDISEKVKIDGDTEQIVKIKFTRV